MHNTATGQIDDVANLSFAPSRAVSQCFGTAAEVLALQVYIHKTAAFTSMYFKYPELWTVVLPCFSWQEPAVKHALLAVAMTDRHMTSGLVSSEHGIQGICHYNAAILRATRCKLSVESLLLLSVLAWLYETMTENAQGSFIHPRAAQRIIRDMTCTQALSTTTSGLVELMEKVDITVSEAEAYTRTIFAEESDNSPGSSSSSSSEGRRTDWTVGATFDSCFHSIEVLEFCVKHLLDSDDTQGGAIAQVIIWLNRWIVAYRRYEPIGSESKAEARVTFRLYNVISALVQIQLYHASEDGKRKCACRDKMVWISRQLSSLLEEVVLSPGIEDCLQLAMLYRWKTAKNIVGGARINC